MKRIIVCVVWTFLVFQESHQENIKQYRKDYEYNDQTDTFYKLHTRLTSADSAVQTCEAEGGDLLLPSSPQDIAHARRMIQGHPEIKLIRLGGEVPPLDKTPTTEHSTQLFLEDSGLFSQGYYFTELANVLTRSGEVVVKDDNEWMQFVCKVKAKDVSYDPVCQVYGKNYTFFSNVSSCYKIPGIAAIWDDAKADCEAEGAHLVVINSESENEIVKNIIEVYPVPSDGSFSNYFYLGFSVDPNDESRVFRTVFNQTLEEAGFVHWTKGEPNNLGWKPENCGSMVLPEGTFNDINCLYQLGYVCEKDVFSNNL